MDLDKIKKSKMPSWISPMLAKLIDKPFDSPDWLFEIKWDGFRILSFVDKSNVRLLTRNQNLYNNVYPIVVEALQALKTEAIFDGEVVAIDKHNKVNFQLLANYQNNSDVLLCYYIFDILYYKGRDLRDLPLIERKEILKGILAKADSDVLRFSDHVENDGIKLFKQAEKKGLEGIIGKDKNSTYVSRRTSDWVKIKTSLRQEAVIGGFTQPKGSRSHFGALLLGIYNPKKELEYIGHVGGGFDTKSLANVYAKLKPLIQKKCPFKTCPKGNDVITWVKPKLLCEVSFAEWTTDRKIRQPIFHGLRADKKSTEVKMEIAEPLKKVKKEAKEDDIVLTHLDKVYWKKDKITKGDMIEYYDTVSKYILPYLKNRPLMLKRYPEGIDGEIFYQKDIKYPPSWMDTAVIQHSDKKVRYVLVQDKKTLLYVANLGSIELHPMICQAQSLKTPDFIAIDLDPLEVPFKVLVEVANEIHEFLEEIKIPHYCKTSGATGLHIYIPLKAEYPFEQTEAFAELLANIVQDRMPDIISLERSPKKRVGKVYFDYLQNTHGGHSMIAPYSLRGIPYAPVSTPLEWKEVNSKLDPTSFNIHTVPARLKKIGDIFKPVLTKSINLKAILKRLEQYAS